MSLKKDCPLNRFVELDALRGIAAVSVVILHYTTTVTTIFPEVADTSFQFHLGGLGVHLFFLISGYVILMTARVRKSPIEFIKARLIRIYPTYWAGLTLSVLVVFGLHSERLYRPWWEILVNYTMLQNFVNVRDFDGVYWTLARELIFYVLIAIGLGVTASHLGRRFIEISTLAWSIGGLLLIGLFRWTNVQGFDLLIKGSVAQYAALFSLGMLLYMRRQEGSSSLVIYIFLPIAFLSEGLMNSWSMAGGSVVLIALFFFVVSQPSVLVLRWKPLLWLGGISYPLYLVHQNIGYTLINATHEYLGVWGSRFFAFVIVVLLAWGVHEAIEVRATRALKKRFL